MAGATHTHTRFGRARGAGSLSQAFQAADDGAHPVSCSDQPGERDGRRRPRFFVCASVFFVRQRQKEQQCRSSSRARAGASACWFAFRAAQAADTSISSGARQLPGPPGDGRRRRTTFFVRQRRGAAERRQERPARFQANPGSSRGTRKNARSRQLPGPAWERDGFFRATAAELAAEEQQSASITTARLVRFPGGPGS